MYRMSDIYRPISEYSNVELELQKECYRKASYQAIIKIKQILADLDHAGVFVRAIRIYEQSPCAAAFPDSIRLVTGRPINGHFNENPNNSIDVAWDYWRNGVIQHVVEPEVL